MFSLPSVLLLSPRLHSPPRTGRIASIAPAARFEAFDWLDHWQPIAWARDVPLDKPTKITLFDVDYAVTRRSDREPLALLDRCPHRGAALSEGRVTSQGWLQCAYHGWAFDTGGACQSVPQQERAPTSALPCVASRACVEHHGMLWLHPSAATEAAAKWSVPDYIPEMSAPGWRVGPAVRDLPIDYTLLVENICDPDHGLFAHQVRAWLGLG